MTIGERSDEVRVQAYFQCLAASDLQRPPYERAFDEIWELTVSDPEKAWPLAVLIIQRTPEDFRLMASAAGWLQNILEHHGPKN